MIMEHDHICTRRTPRASGRKCRRCGRTAEATVVVTVGSQDRTSFWCGACFAGLDLAGVSEVVSGVVLRAVA